MNNLELLIIIITIIGIAFGFLRRGKKTNGVSLSREQ
jgi:hypothetical protein